MKLQWNHSVLTGARDRRVEQEMRIVIDYDPSEDAIGDCEVHVYQAGRYLGEISKLLANAEGNPLIAMIEAIDWREVYRDQREIYREQLAESHGY